VYALNSEIWEKITEQGKLSSVSRIRDTPSGFETILQLQLQAQVQPVARRPSDHGM